MTPIPHQTCSDHVAEGHELISESMTVSKVLQKIAAPDVTPELPTGLMMNRQLMRGGAEFNANPIGGDPYNT